MFGVTQSLGRVQGAVEQVRELHELIVGSEREVEQVGLVDGIDLVF